MNGGTGGIKPGRGGSSVQPQQSFGDECLTKLDSRWCVHPHYRNGRSALGCLADDERAYPAKVLRPVVATRIKQQNHARVLRIDSAQVRSLAEVASQAGEGEV
jgi:hypothetical protein